MAMIIPAYNLDPRMATKFEAQIAKVMHRRRDEEIAKLRLKDKSSEASRPPMHNKTKKPSLFTQPRPNNEMDEEVLRLLKHQWLSVAMIASKIGRTPQAVRHMIDRLYARKQLRRMEGATVTLYCAVGEESQDGCA